MTRYDAIVIGAGQPGPGGLAPSRMTTTGSSPDRNGGVGGLSQLRLQADQGPPSQVNAGVVSAR